jgi:hypothetical protein
MIEESPKSPGKPAMLELTNPGLLNRNQKFNIPF